MDTGVHVHAMVMDVASTRSSVKRGVNMVLHDFRLSTIIIVTTMNQSL